jgi:phosphoribosyl 1,2-cyclic phosphodiesterase
MKIAVLGSGSIGNSTFVEADETRILIDAGFSGRDLERRLEILEVDPASISGIVITHDHGDHTRGMGVLARRFGIPLYITPRTKRVCTALLSGDENIRSYTSAQSFRIGTLVVQPFLTVHDAADPVAITVTDTRTGEKLGIATDLGRPTVSVRHALARCDVLVLEANHDEPSLWRGPYPWSVKQRIASSHGHLSNEASGQLARELHHPALQAVVLAHLSEHCNNADQALQVVGTQLQRVGYKGSLVVALQEEPLLPFDVSVLRKINAPVQMDLFG